MKKRDLADLIRAHPTLSTAEAGRILGLTARSVRLQHENGRLSATRYGPPTRSVLICDTDDVLALALLRALQLDDEHQDDDPDPDALQPTLDQALEDRRSA